MNVVTVFNYPDEEKYNTMFKIWLVSLLRNKTDAIKDIRILTKGLSQPVKDFITWLKRDDIVIVIRDETKVNRRDTKAQHNIGFKLYNMCRETEPFIFLDADMIILQPLDKPVAAGKENDGFIIGVNHQTIPKHTAQFNYKFINTGFLVVPEPDMLDYEILLCTPMEHYCPGNDQCIIYNFLMTTQETYLHPDIGYEWNSCAGFKRFDKGELRSHGVPEDHPVYILHYWDEFKPWNRHCPIYQKYQDFVKNLESPDDITAPINP